MNSIFVIGKISSGKSTLASNLSTTLDAPIISFSTYIKSLCEERGLELIRKNLQDIGQTLVEENPKLFLEKTIDFQIKENESLVIVEGVRHKSILLALKEISEKCVGIYLDIPIETRALWYSNRENKNTSVQEMASIEEHKAESEIGHLKNLCDYILIEHAQLSKHIDEIKSELSTT